MSAIYMWREDAEVILLTTTLYPVVIVDDVQFDVSIVVGTMELVPEDHFDSDYSLENGTYIQMRWFFTDGPYLDDFDSDYSLHNGTYIQVRWFFTDGPYLDDFDSDYSLHDGSLVNKLVTADTPDEELQLDVVISNTCTMDAYP